MIHLHILLALVAALTAQTTTDDQGIYPLPPSRSLTGSVVAEISKCPA